MAAVALARVTAATGEDLGLIASPADLKARIPSELRITRPDYVVFVPEVSACEEPSVVKLPDGRLFCVMRTAAGSPFWSISSDLGETWTVPRRLLRRDGGEPLLHPISPCPIYDVGGNTAGSGRYVLFIHNHDGHYQGYGPTDTGFHRRPIYRVEGRFQAGADQLVWFDEPAWFFDHDGVSLGKPGTRGRLDLANDLGGDPRPGQRAAESRPTTRFVDPDLPDRRPSCAPPAQPGLRSRSTPNRGRRRFETAGANSNRQSDAEASPRDTLNEFEHSTRIEDKGNPQPRP